MKYRFFLTNGQPVDGFNMDNIDDLDAGLANLAATKGLSRNQVAILSLANLSGFNFRFPVAVVNSTDPANPVVDDLTDVSEDTAAIEQADKDYLDQYTRQNGVLHAATIINPLTTAPVYSGTDPKEAAAEMSDFRAQVEWYAQNGTPAQQTTANNIIATMRTAYSEIFNIREDVQAGTVTTEAQVDARITAIDMTY